MTDIDEALRADSRQWNGSLPAPADLDAHLGRLSTSAVKHSPWRWIVPALAAAVVVAVAVGVALATTNSPGPKTHSGAGATSSPSPTSTIPSTRRARVAMPLVVGLQALAAVRRLLHDGLRTVQFVAEANPQPAGKVLAQSPHAFALIAGPASRPVRLKISAGPNPAGSLILVPGVGTCTFVTPPSRLCIGGPVVARVLNYSSTEPNPDSKVVLASAYEAQFRIPATWTTTPYYGTSFDQDGPTGFEVVGAASLPTSSPQPLRTICESLATSNVLNPYGTHPAVTITQVDGHAACLIRPSADGSAESHRLHGPRFQNALLVVRYRTPIAIRGTRYGLLTITTDPSHLAAIAATMNIINGH